MIYSPETNKPKGKKRRVRNV